MGMKGLFARPAGLVMLAIATVATVSVAQEADESPDRSVAEHMHQHLSAMRAMKIFIVAGQLDGVREPAVWVAEHKPTPGLPADWQPYVAELRRYAEYTASARHLVFAAAAVSEMARVCGDCHQANGVQLATGAGDSPPADVAQVAAQMRRHMWAVDRMWEGLIAASDNAWNQGAEVLARIRLEPADIGAAGEEPRVAYLLDRARAIGVEGRNATTREGRSLLYGELLTLADGPAPLAQRRDIARLAVRVREPGAIAGRDLAGNAGAELAPGILCASLLAFTGAVPANGRAPRFVEHLEPELVGVRKRRSRQSEENGDDQDARGMHGGFLRQLAAG
jgi:mono/diheme cytochrome c family protein